MEKLVMRSPRISNESTLAVLFISDVISSALD